MTRISDRPATSDFALEANDLVVDYRRGRRVTRAVDGTSFRVKRGETVGIVGESGSGKTTVARAVLGLVPVTSGSLSLGGRAIPRSRDRKAFAAQLQVVFQDPYSSLDPAQLVGSILAESLGGSRLSRREVALEVTRTLESVGLEASAAARYPGQFSGGQRQRIAIARAIIRRPEIVVCDEPLSALDLSIQAQIVNLLMDLQVDHGLSYLFIAHDLTVVRHLCQRVVVMYRGQLIESGPAEAVYDRPGHPYTQALLAAAPIPDPVMQRRRQLARAARTVASADKVSSTGCPFASRCPFALPICVAERPALRPRLDEGEVACHRYPELAVSAAAERRIASPSRNGVDDDRC